MVQRSSLMLANVAYLDSGPSRYATLTAYMASVTGSLAVEMSAAVLTILS